MADADKPAEGPAPSPVDAVAEEIRRVKLRLVALEQALDALQERVRRGEVEDARLREELKRAIEEWWQTHGQHGPPAQRGQPG